MTAVILIRRFWPHTIHLIMIHGLEWAAHRNGHVSFCNNKLDNKIIDFNLFALVTVEKKNIFTISCVINPVPIRSNEVFYYSHSFPLTSLSPYVHVPMTAVTCAKSLFIHSIQCHNKINRAENLPSEHQWINIQKTFNSENNEEKKKNAGKTIGNWLNWRKY